MSTLFDKSRHHRSPLAAMEEPAIDVSTPEDPAAAFAAADALRRLADRLERRAVDRAVGEGWTWAQIAQALGITRQAAHKRHARRLRGASEPEDR